MEEKPQNEILTNTNPQHENENELNVNNCAGETEKHKEKFDLNEHLFKYLSVMNLSQEDNEAKKQNYCLKCKMFFNSDLLADHEDHELIDHSKDLQNINVLNSLFDNLEEKFFKTFTNDLSDFDKQLKQRIEKSIESLVNNLENLKKSKIEDLENLMSNHSLNFQRIKKDFFELKYKFTQFYKKNDTFLSLSHSKDKAAILKLNGNLKKNQSSVLDLNMSKVNQNNVTQEVNNNNNYNSNNNLNKSIRNFNNNNNNILNASDASFINNYNYKSNKPNSKTNYYFENQVINDIFYLINLDLNKSIESTELKLENFLNNEKEKIKSQAEILDNLFAEFKNKVNKFQEDFKIKPILESKGAEQISNMFPDFAHSLHLRLKKYTEIFNNLNCTLLDLKNPTSYKKIESLIGDMENDVIYRLTQRNANCVNGSKLFVPESCYEMDFKNIVDNLDDLDNLDLDNNVRLGKEDNEFSNAAQTGLLTSKNKVNSDLKTRFNISDKTNSYCNNEFKSKSDNKANQTLLNRHNQLSSDNSNNKSNSEFNFANEDEIKGGAGARHLSKVKEMQRNRKKNVSLNLDNINLDSLNSNSSNKILNSSVNKNQSLTNIQFMESNSKLNDCNNSSTVKLNPNNYESSGNYSILNNSTTNKSSMSFWKNKEDLLKKYLILSLMGTYEEIQEIEEENENPNVNSSKIEKIMQENDYLNNINEPFIAKIIEKTNEILIYDKKSLKISKQKVNLKKEIHGIDSFLDGSRTIIAMDKIFIIGGRDALQQFALGFEYDHKLNYIKKIPNMLNPRAYHTLVFNPRTIRIIAIGGENSKSCEEYDLYKGTWHALPDLNVPRAYVNCYLNKNKSVIYALFGLKGEITKDNFTDTVEIMELDRKEKGWVKVNYNNKCDINLKTKYVHVFPIEADKLLIVGNCYSRYSHKTFAIYDLKIDNISKIDSRLILEIRRKSKNDPALKKLLLDINKSLN